jgi:hypothetical protein
MGGADTSANARIKLWVLAGRHFRVYVGRSDGPFVPWVRAMHGKHVGNGTAMGIFPR